ncbi:pentatricopeptide repeat-containing protein At1g73710 [Cucurbita pepo subsp. pepo]|uniref:pentatricopeptide repeat-containing protein At1g73710 n=1 Tax=Cucurbita pepo subsp. pepo TaxID=3664 RepID=UPI000C9D68EA|nr:pentatricopeptide repeat-containing protein At1g73710 [Cucurbita pepo subsp. pepo]
MMLQVGSCRELGQDSFTASLIQTNFTAKGHHYLFLNTPLASRRLSLGNLNSQKPIIRDLKVSSGFKLQCLSKTVFTPSKRLSTNGKKKSYGGVLPSILRSLKSSSDIGSILNSLCQNLSPKEQTVILKEQRQWERVLQVFQWFKSQKDYVPNVIHYNIVLRALGRAQKWDELRLCWNEMAENGIIPSNNTYGMLVDVYGKAGLVKEALLWIKHMKVRGIFPDEVTMNTVVRVLKDAGEFDSADKFYKDWCRGMVELNDFDLNSRVDDLGLNSTTEPITLKHFLLTELFRTGMKIPNRKASPEVDNCTRKPRLTSTFNTLIDLYGKAGRLKDAANVFAEMLKSGIPMDTITFNTMIFTCGSHGHLAEAETLLSKMEERGLSPDTKTYNIFLSLYADEGNIDGALKCYRRIREVGLFPDVVTHRALLHILSKRNMVEDVENVIAEMEKLHVLLDEHSLPCVIEMYINNGLLDRAKMFLEKYRLDTGLPPKILTAIIDAYAEKGLWSEAEDVFLWKKDLVGQNLDVMEYNVMIKAYGKAELYDKAFLLFKGMKNRGTWPDECTYNSLIQMFSGGDLVDEARRLLTEMHRIGFKPNCQTFSAVIASYARLGQMSDAVDVYDIMVNAEVEPNEILYGVLINGFAELGLVEEALKYFHLMKGAGIAENRIVLTSLIKAFSKVGSVEGAKAMYNRMKNMENGVDTIASNSMINLYTDLGMVSEAKRVFEDLRERGCADGVSFATMIYLYKNTGMLDEAIEVAEEMKEAGLLRDSASFHKVIECYAIKGQLRECGELLHEMVTRKLSPDNATFKVLFTILKKGGIPIEAITQLESAYHEGKPYAQQAIVAAVFSAVGLHAPALESCQAFLNAEVELDSFAYNVAINAYGVSGDIDKALIIFMKMQDHNLNPDLVTYMHLVSCYGKAGMIEGMMRVYSQLKYGEIEPSKSLFYAIINACRTANRYDLVQMVKQEMQFSLHSELFSRAELDDLSDEDSPPSV